jgi:Cu/Ag efflux protein CusF
VKKLLAGFLVLVVLVAFSLPALAKETVKGKVEALDKEAKKVTIGGTEYSLSDEASHAEVKVGDEVEATRKLKKLAMASQRIPMDANPAISHMFIVNPLSGG